MVAEVPIKPERDGADAETALDKIIPQTTSE